MGFPKGRERRSVRLGRMTDLFLLHHRLVMKVGCTVVLQPTQRLAGVRKEWHTRRQGGKDVAYVVSDRLGEYAVISQKLALLTQWINAQADSKGSRISTTALYEGADRGSETRDGEYVKGRWKVRTVDLDKASEEFERARQASSRGTIVAAEPSCYVVCA